METKKIFGIFAAVIVMVAAVGFASAQGFYPSESPLFGGFGMFWMPFTNGNSTAMQDIWSAITGDNYTAWVSAVEAQLTQANFDRLVNMTKGMNQTRLQNWTNRTFAGNWTDSDNDSAYEHPGYGNWNINQTENWTSFNRTAPNWKGDDYRRMMKPMSSGGFFGRNRDN